MSEPITLRLRGPGGEPVDLWRTINSHGFSDLPPLRVDTTARTLEVTLRVPRGKPRRVRISAERGGTRAAAEVVGGPPPSAAARAAIAAGLARVLHLEHDLSSFYATAAGDPALSWAGAGAGRMLRSPTVWEDVVKTVCTTNCSWALTVRMVQALVRELGDPAAGHEDDPLANAFPGPTTMAAQPEPFYREVVRAGYRSPSFVRLAELVASSEVDLERLGEATREELSDDEVEERLLALPGVGPYAAAHILMTLGRNSRLILDSWTRPTYAARVGRRTVADATIRRRFRRFGPEAGLAFWLFVTEDWVTD